MVVEGFGWLVSDRLWLRYLLFYFGLGFCCCADVGVLVACGSRLLVVCYVLTIDCLWSGFAVNSVD